MRTKKKNLKKLLSAHSESHETAFRSKNRYPGEHKGVTSVVCSKIKFNQFFIRVSITKAAAACQ